MQNAYELRALKLIKAVVTRWLSHGKAVQRVLDRYEALVASLDAIYLRKQEPAVRGLRDELIQPKVIATMCFLADVLQSTNTLQIILQGARKLIFFRVKRASAQHLAILPGRGTFVYRNKVIFTVDLYFDMTTIWGMTKAGRLF